MSIELSKGQLVLFLIKYKKIKVVYNIEKREKFDRMK